MTEVLGLPIIGRVPQGRGSRRGPRVARRRRGVPAAARQPHVREHGPAPAHRRGRLLRRAGGQVDDRAQPRARGRRARHGDADRRGRPAPPEPLGQGGRLGRRERLGLSSLLVHRGSLEEATWPVPGTSVDLLPSGPLPPNPAALLGSPALRELDEEARDRYSLVLYDTPPLSVSADAPLVSAIADGVVLVVDARRTRRAPASPGRRPAAARPGEHPRRRGQPRRRRRGSAPATTPPSRRHRRRPTRSPAPARPRRRNTSGQEASRNLVFLPMCFPTTNSSPPKGQTRCEAGTQSHGTPIGVSRVSEGAPHRGGTTHGRPSCCASGHGLPPSASPSS